MSFYEETAGIAPTEKATVQSLTDLDTVIDPDWGVWDITGASHLINDPNNYATMQIKAGADPYGIRKRAWPIPDRTRNLAFYGNRSPTRKEVLFALINPDNIASRPGDVVISRQFGFTPRQWKPLDRWHIYNEVAAIPWYRSLVSGSQPMDTIAQLRREKVIAPAIESWNLALDTETEPDKYLEILKTWEVVGASPTLLAEKANAYEELLTAEYIHKTFSMMETTRTLQDLDLLIHTYNYFLNRVLVGDWLEISSPVRITVNSEDSAVPDVVHARLPRGTQETIKRITAKVQQILVRKLFEMEMALVTYGAISYSTPYLSQEARDRLKQVAPGEEVYIPFESTPEMLDPAKNLCWVPDAQATRDNGIATWVNTCTNRNVDFQLEPKSQVIPTFALATEEEREGVTTPWTPTAFELAPAVRSTYVRTIPTASGYKSINDLENAGLLPKKGPGLGTLLAVGGIGAAVWALQSV